MRLRTTGVRSEELGPPELGVRNEELGPPESFLKVLMGLGSALAKRVRQDMRLARWWLLARRLSLRIRTTVRNTYGTLR